MGLLDSIFGSGNQTVTQKTKLPSWYTDAAKDLISYGNAGGSWLAAPYLGNQVAALDPLQKDVVGRLGANMGSTNAGYDTALGGMSGGMSYQPSQIGAQFLQGDINGYMDPYIQDVINPAMADLESQRLQAQNSNADAAYHAGAFGGSRHGVVEGVTNAESAKAAGQLSAGLRSQGYNNAVGLAQQAAQSNQNAGLMGAQLRANSSAQYGDLTAAQQAAYLQSLNSGLQGGNINQQQNQQLLTQAGDQYNAMRNYPLELYNARLSALSGLQLPTTQRGTTAGGGGLASGLMGGVGGALAGAGLFGTGGALAGLGGITAGGGAGLGAVLGLLGGLSDENEKTNIEKLGTDPKTGLDIFAYDYKSDVKRAKKEKTPLPMKRVGPMAQDIEAKYPGSTTRIGGKLVVANLGFGM